MSCSVRCLRTYAMTLRTLPTVTFVVRFRTAIQGSPFLSSVVGWRISSIEMVFQSLRRPSAGQKNWFLELLQSRYYRYCEWPIIDQMLYSYWECNFFPLSLQACHLVPCLLPVRNKVAQWIRKSDCINSNSATTIVRNEPVNIDYVDR